MAAVVDFVAAAADSVVAAADSVVAVDSAAAAVSIVKNQGVLSATAQGVTGLADCHCGALQPSRASTRQMKFKTAFLLSMMFAVGGALDFSRDLWFSYYRQISHADVIK